MRKAVQSFFGRWTVIPVFENRVFIVKDENDAKCPMLPISPDEYERLKTATSAHDLQGMLDEFKKQTKLAKGHGHG